MKNQKYKHNTVGIMFAKQSVVGKMVDAPAPAAPTSATSGRGRPKAERELKKRISLSVLPSLYEDIQRIAYVERRSASELVAAIMEQYRAEHTAELAEYHKIKSSN